MDVKSILKLMAAIAIAGGLAACKKDDGPEGPTDLSGGCEAVDLGLSVKWASYNVGAKTPEGYGSYFAWGETAEKSNYDWSEAGQYKWGVFNDGIMTKYMADKIKTLQPEDDAATVVWGDKWRMPTVAEIDELVDVTKCKWTWDDSKKGYIVQGLKTGNSIFLPAAGYRNGTELRYAGEDGGYWSSSVFETYQFSAHILNFDTIGMSTHDSRCYGFTVRAVTEY